MTQRTRAITKRRGAASGLGAGLLALVLAGACGPAAADSYCGNGRHVGSENDGAGMSWRCVPDVTRSRPAVQSGGGGGGGRGAVGQLQGLAALLSIASSLGSMVAANEERPPVPNVDVQEAAVKSRKLNREAIEALRDGDFAYAAHLFQYAADAAWVAGNTADALANTKNAKLADAENMLKQGFMHEHQGKLAEASTFYMRGKQAAEAAGAADLAGKLAEYNDRLMALAGGAKDGVNDTRTSCATINGQFICR